MHRLRLPCVPSLRGWATMTLTKSERAEIERQLTEKQLVAFVSSCTGCKVRHGWYAICPGERILPGIPCLCESCWHEGVAAVRMLPLGLLDQMATEAEHRFAPALPADWGVL